MYKIRNTNKYPDPDSTELWTADPRFNKSNRDESKKWNTKVEPLESYLRFDLGMDNCS